MKDMPIIQWKRDSERERDAEATGGTYKMWIHLYKHYGTTKDTKTRMIKKWLRESIWIFYNELWIFF